VLLSLALLLIGRFGKLLVYNFGYSLVGFNSTNEFDDIL